MCDNIIIISLVLVFIFLALSVNTIINRRKYGLALGEGDSENLKRAVRAHDFSYFLSKLPTNEQCH